ncbi:VOC family protein [Fluviicola sp.]|uniref:VOC family protein n=1 Tax=Fluviicola sp. TaxID=1917219 RepID=UPI0031D985F2
MIQREQIFSSFSAENTDEAYFFYKNVLGLEVEKGEMSILTLHINSGMKVIIYPKQDHEPATFTVLNIPVTDIDDAVEELNKKGVSFLQYDEAYLKTDSKGICRNEHGPAMAWFTDPSKNILGLIQV